MSADPVRCTDRPDDDPDVSERSFDAMAAVAKRLLDGWFPMARAHGDGAHFAWRKRSHNPAKWADITRDEWQALQQLDWAPDA